MDRKSFVYSIISGIIASILFSLFLMPLSQWIWEYSTNSANHWLIEIQNIAFRNAALGNRNWVSALSFILIYTLCVSSIIGVISGDFLHKFIRRRIFENSNSKEEKINGFIFRHKVLLLAFPAFYLIYFGGKQSFFVYTDMQMNASFEQRINAIRPYTNDQDIYILKSKWALMKNRSDYESIQESIESQAIENKIILPHLLYK